MVAAFEERGGAVFASAKFRPHFVLEDSSIH
jgi:hypothetical protein